MRIMLMAGLLLAFAAAADQSVASGRYTMMPAEDGSFIRLDTETGAMAICRSTDGGWDCKPLRDDAMGLAEENKLLRDELAKLRTELNQLESHIFPKEGGEPPRSAPSGPAFQLPTEEELDKALTYMQRIIRKFKEKIEELEDETKRKPPAPSTPL